MTLSTDEFVASVAEHLAALRRADDPGYVTQDQLDVMMLGGTVPAIEIPQPDPDCESCWGTGALCSCHGFARASNVCRMGVTEMCGRCLPRWYVEARSRT